MKPSTQTTCLGLGALLGALALVGAVDASAAQVISLGSTPGAVPTAPGQVFATDYASQGLLEVIGGTIALDGTDLALTG